MAGSDGMSAGGDLGAGIGGTLGALIGYALSGEDRQKALDNLRAGRDVWTGIDPTVRAQAEQVVNQGPSAYESLSVDPAARQAQARAWQQLGQLGMSGGVDAQSQARLAQTMDQSAAADSANRASLAQQYEAMGRAGGLGSYVAQLSAQQSTAHNNALAAVQAAGDASARAMSATQQSGALAGQARGQDYQQASDLAAARDAVAAHNAANRQGVYQRNADRTQSAEESTLQGQLARARGLNDSYNSESDYWTRNGQQKMGVGYGVGSALGRGAGMYIGGKG